MNSRPIWHVINKHKTMANTRLFACLPAELVTYPGVLCLCPEQTEFSRGRLSNQLKTLVLAAHFSRDGNANISAAALPTLSDCKGAAHFLSREPGQSAHHRCKALIKRHGKELKITKPRTDPPCWLLQMKQAFRKELYGICHSKYSPTPSLRQTMLTIA